jgi:hypothetical protein
MVGYVLVRRTGYRLTEVASCLVRDMATVSSLISRLAERIHADRHLSMEVDRLAKIVWKGKPDSTNRVWGPYFIAFLISTEMCVL